MRNLISIFIHRSIPAAKAGLTLFALTALLIAGASSAMRLNLDRVAQTDNSVLVEQVSLDPDPADISSESENMNPATNPNGEPNAIIGQLILSGGLTNDQARVRLSYLISSEIVRTDRSHVAGRPVGSIAMVSTSLGHQFTLVGAKPDGTS